MAEELQSFFSRLLTRIPGLEAALVTDRDGVIVIKAVTDAVSEQALQSSFLATFALATEQAGKLGLGKNRSVTCMYENHQVIHFGHLPLIISLIASADANTGILLNLEKELKAAVDPVVAAFKSRAPELDIN
eukprot:Opistho-2@72546